MRGAFVGTVGALAIVAAAAGLSLDAFRAGPYDRVLEPVVVPVPYQAEASFGSPAPLGICPLPPCPTIYELDVRLEQMPHVPYDLRVAGPSGAAVELGTFEPVDGVIEVHWSDEGDHADKDRLILAVAGRDVGELRFRELSGLLLAWGAEPDTVHVNEIGGVTLSTVATASLDEEPPEGWEFRARFEGQEETVHLGALEASDGGVVLDGRAERLRLEDHEAVLIVLAPVGAEADAGFPVLRADLWP